LTCTTNVTVTPQLRGEGFTEQTGDITLSCTGGTPIVAGNTIPLVNITVFYNTLVTSRLLPSTAGGSNASEALLLIDEPGSGLSGYGPTLPQKLCGNPLAGCPAQVGAVPGPTFNTSIDPSVAGLATPSPNVYQGIVSGNSVTFFGIPVLPPTTTGSRVYRITNVRVNANTLGGSSSSGSQPVQASISISGATSLSISQSSLAVGYVQSGLSTGVSSSNLLLQQCATQSKAVAGQLNFTENFGTAFKTRVVPQTNTAYAGQINNPPLSIPPYVNGSGAFLQPANQNTPGAIYNSESNFVYPISGAVYTPGLANYGTRLKAIFNNIPTGATLYVSTSNITNLVTPVLPPNGIIGGTGITTYAVLVNGETTDDGTASGGFFPTVTATDNIPSGPSTPWAVAIPTPGGIGTAVWEIVNTNPNTTETVSFGAWISYTSNVAQGTPVIGTSTVNLSYAATAASAAASSTLTIPRFIPDGTAARSLLAINICRTILLYPYITNQAGFDTGLTVANTSQDPYTLGSKVTLAQAGSCTFTWYGGTTAAPLTPPAPTNTGNIAGGTVWTGLASILVPTYQGYAFAVCNFQFAHGFAFISDLGARNLAMGYLAVVMTDPSTGSRPATGGATNAEWGGH
jgi:hypothetical protein